MRIYSMFFMSLFLAVSIAECGSSCTGGAGSSLGGLSGTTGTAPTVTLTVPAPGETPVPINRKIVATFSQAMDPTTINATTFTLMAGSTPVQGTVTVVAGVTSLGSVATFTPTSNLAVSTKYTVTITTGAKNLAGNALAADFVWSFTTGSTTDTTAPTVSSTYPGIGVTGAFINGKVIATFSKAMDPATINATTFTLMQGSTPVVGTVAWAGLIATFTPTSNLAVSSKYTATITTGAKDLAGNALAANFVWSFTTAGASGSGPGGGPTDTTAPTVSSAVPVVGATNVATNSHITAAFSKAMDPLTISTSTFLVACPTGTPIAGTVSYAVSGTIATFIPTSNLPATTVCTVTITSGVKDTAGNALASPFSWTFTTAAGPDITPPTVTLTAPVAGATGVALNSLITTTFSESMDPLTITTATVLLACPAGTAVAGTVGYAVSGNKATFTPTSSLPASTVCTGTITTGVKDLAGNALASPFTWTFTTGTAPGSSHPTVSSVVPLAAAINVARNPLIAATFSTAMDPLTITTGTYSLACPTGTPVAGTISFSGAGTVATFTPTATLPASTVCTGTITTGVKDTSGNAMVSPFTWSFTTGTTTTSSRAKVNLLSSEPFAILTKTGVTDVPASPITGYVGASPITGAAILVTCAEVNGGVVPNIYAVDAAGPAPCSLGGGANKTLVDNAVADMVTAYGDAQGRTLPDATELGAGEIGGLTIVPGLFKWSTDVNISTSVTLSGSATDVWIFQISGDLIMAPGVSVILAGGASASNVFWQVAGLTGATLNTTAHMEGTILSAKQVILRTGASANSRLMAQTQVVLDHNTVVKPAP